jgi:hypothetical protein
MSGKREGGRGSFPTADRVGNLPIHGPERLAWLECGLIANGGYEMSVTVKIPREELTEYFDSFTKRFLRDGSPEAVDIEVLEPDWGDQVSAQGARLIGVTYESDKGSLEFELDSGDHRVYQPAEVWVVEEPDGFLSAIEVVRQDGSRDVVSVKRVGLRRLD